MCGDAGLQPPQNHSSNITSRDIQPISQEACFEIRAGSIEGQVVSTSSEHIGAQVA